MNKAEKMTFLNILKIEWKHNKKDIFYQLLNGLCSAFLSFPTILFPPLIIDYLINGKVNEVYLIILLFSGVSLILTILSYFLYAKFQSGVYNLPYIFNKKNIYKSIIIDFKYMETKKSLDEFNNSMKMPWTCSEIVYNFFNVFISSIVKMALIIAILATLDWYIVLFVFIIVCVNFLINRKIIKKNKDFEIKGNKISRYSDYYENILFKLEYGKEIRLYPKSKKLYKELYDKYAIEKIKHEKHVHKYNYLMDIILKLIGFIENLGIYIMMIYKYSLGKISIGSFFVYIGTANEMYNAFQNMSDMIVKFSKFKTYADVYNNFMEYPNVTSSSNQKIEFKDVNIIEFENVCFTYPNTDNEILHNISLKISLNEKTLIVGENGTGKSTIIKLILRFYEPTSGVIKLNGINIKEYDYSEYLKLFSSILQDFKLFKISIKDNICFDSFEEDRFIDAITKVELKEKVEQLKLKENSFIDREIDSDGIDMSGGERQRLAIARAIYKNAQTYIFDEPTATLDPFNEQKINNIFNDSIYHNSAIIISHRMSFAKKCDNIIVIENGAIYEQGSFSQLIEKKGKFYEQYKVQAEYYK